VGDGSGKLADCAELGGSDELLLNALDLAELVAHAREQSGVFHGHGDLVGDELCQADEHWLENSLAAVIEHVKPAQALAAVVHEPKGQSRFDIGLARARCSRGISNPIGDRWH